MIWITCLTLASYPVQDGQTADKGPIHEAFAQPLDAKSVRGPLLSKQPPQAIREEPPEDKPEGDNVAWIDGYWHHDADRDDYLWISGFWRQFPPGQKWIPGHFQQESGGWRWYSGYWQAEEQVDQEPESDQPPASLDIGPSIPAPRADMIWAPGFHVRRDRVWVWRPGTWISYRPGWVWNPARWVFTRRGFVFVQGYWDYPLEYRGVIYAPVYYPPAVVVRPGFFHRPSVVIVNSDLSCGLFSRPGFGNYYFGNYFTPVYVNQGFVFWAAQRPMYRPDPIFAYYRQARDQAWVAGVQDYGRLRAQGKPATAPALALAPANGPKTPLVRQAGDTVRIVPAGQQGKVVLKNNAPPPQKTDIPTSQVVVRPLKPGAIATKPVATPAAPANNTPKPAAEKDSPKGKHGLKDLPKDAKPAQGKDLPKDNPKAMPEKDLPKGKQGLKDLPKDAKPAQGKDLPKDNPKAMPEKDSPKGKQGLKEPSKDSSKDARPGTGKDTPKEPVNPNPTQGSLPPKPSSVQPKDAATPNQPRPIPQVKESAKAPVGGTQPVGSNPAAKPVGTPSGTPANKPVANPTPGASRPAGSPQGTKTAGTD
ncbi:MAG: YXWGXW repeat-containing protein, partial [Planctomycetes bacterium]|nr:YXWGXW repeat-containing protein [Planctomycetota bacterium]